MRTRYRAWLLLWLMASPVLAAVSVRDGVGETVQLNKPAQRIISLSPSTTEMLYAVGGGSRMVGTVDYSDYPPAARLLPKVGSLTGIGLEAILRLRPDLVVLWRDGASVQLIARLRGQNIAVFVSQPRRLDDVGTEMLALGHLLGTDRTAAQAVQHYRQQIQRLQQRYQHVAPVSVFYQVSPLPLFTVSNQSFLGAMLQLCGGRNVFGDLRQPAPQVSPEAVVAAKPQLMLAPDRENLALWDRWPSLPAVAHATRYTVNADLAGRPGPRLAQGAEQICQMLDRARLVLGLTPR